MAFAVKNSYCHHNKEVQMPKQPFPLELANTGALIECKIRKGIQIFTL
jgi:hypothetical protein